MQYVHDETIHSLVFVTAIPKKNSPSQGFVIFLIIYVLVANMKVLQAEVRATSDTCIHSSLERPFFSL